MKKQQFHSYCEFTLLEVVFKELLWNSAERTGIDFSVSIHWFEEINGDFLPRGTSFMRISQMWSEIQQNSGFCALVTSSPILFSFLLVTMTSKLVTLKSHNLTSHILNGWIVCPGSIASMQMCSDMTIAVLDSGSLNHPARWNKIKLKVEERKEKGSDGRE